MYCESCCRIIEETNRCPHCRGKKIRDPEPKDPCFLTELNYVNSSILEDVLKQEGIPYLRKDLLGAGLAIRVGPVLDWGRFFVSYENLEKAKAIVDGVFSDKKEAEDE